MANRPTTARGLAVTVLAPLALIALAMGAVGCGSTTSTQTGSGGAATSAASGTPAPSRARFVAQAEGFCRTLSSGEKPLKAREEALKGLPSAAYDKAFVVVANQVVALSRTAAEKLKTLPRPPADAASIEKALDAYSEEVADVANISYSVANQESSAGEAAVAALKRSIAGNASLAERYGLKDCTGSE